MKYLDELLGNIAQDIVSDKDPQTLQIRSITADSRQAGNGSLFIALSGENVDGHKFIPSAIEKGCSAIIAESGKYDKDLCRQSSCTVVEVDSSRTAYGVVAANFYDNPQKDLTFIGITGTNGKTTITYLLETIMGENGGNLGIIGTVNYRYINYRGVKKLFPAPFTTPDPAILQKLLREMVDNGVSTVIMEVSSHALAQLRLGGILFDIAAFTNLSHDHLDYHNTMEEYFEAKTLLFTDHLKADGKAVVTFSGGGKTRQGQWSEALLEQLRKLNIETYTVGYHEDSVIIPGDVDIQLTGTIFEVQTPEGNSLVDSPLVGRFNSENILTTLGIVYALKKDIIKALTSLRSANGAPGRLERVTLDQKKGPAIFVDYAHTPDALLNVLSTVKELPHRRCIAVFGCGGDRDKTKRPKMGEIVAGFADIGIVTNDNPRSESPDSILQHIEEGLAITSMTKKELSWLYSDSKEKGYVLLADRRQAIQHAVRCSGVDDIVLIAGKGHEKYQLLNDGKRFFDDCHEAREALLSWNIETVERALKSTPVNVKDDRKFTGISTDSRKLEKGQLFVALEGENFDGHDYLDKAVANGAAGLVVSNPGNAEKYTDLPIFIVENGEKALGALAGYRKRVIADITSLLVVGLTGSCGKTTVKEMIDSIFRRNWPDGESNPAGRVLKTKGNFNNLIGLPLSLFPLELKHEAAILEMGMNRPGEIADLAKIADPDICCIINVHGAHLEGLGSIEGVASAKAELFEESRTDALHILNLDDEQIVNQSKRFSQRKISFTTVSERKDDADIWAEQITVDRNGNVAFVLATKESKHSVQMQVPGKHNVTNGLAAAAVAFAANIELDIIVEGLSEFIAVDKRLQSVEARNNCFIINDTYNANPGSMAAGLQTLVSMSGTSKVAVLGDMLELGKISEKAHEELGLLAAQSGLDFLGLVGSFASSTKEGALNGGMSDDQVVIFQDKEKAASHLLKMLKSGEIAAGSWILIKASRGLALESIVERLKK